MSQSLSQCLLCQIVPLSQGDLCSSLKSKFLFDTLHLYFLKAWGKAGHKATLASAFSWAVLWEEREGETCVRSALYCLLMPTHHKVKAYKKAKFYNSFGLREAVLEVRVLLSCKQVTWIQVLVSDKCVFTAKFTLFQLKFIYGSVLEEW